MFAFFLMTLLLAVMTDNTNKVLVDDKIVASELATRKSTNE